MNSVVTTVTIDGDPEAVFDLVTTARFWPQWHPATIAVGGVTQRPYGLGDRIHEHDWIGSKKFQITWKVAEHMRPSRVVLRSERSPAQITYSFQARGGTTLFMRELKYRLKDLDSLGLPRDKLDQLMKVQSKKAVEQMKESVEKILREEAVGLQ